MAWLVGAASYGESLFEMDPAPMMAKYASIFRGEWVHALGYTVRECSEALRLLVHAFGMTLPISVVYSERPGMRRSRPRFCLRRAFTSGHR